MRNGRWVEAGVLALGLGCLTPAQAQVSHLPRPDFLYRETAVMCAGLNLAFAEVAEPADAADYRRRADAFRAGLLRLVSLVVAAVGIVGCLGPLFRRRCPLRHDAVELGVLPRLLFTLADAFGLTIVRRLSLIAEPAKLDRAWEERVPELVAHHGLDGLGKCVPRHPLKGDEVHLLVQFRVIRYP